MKLGSLFDGAGTAPLAAQMCGITPVWASEIEPYPIRVTTARFPDMLHVGDICKLDGAALEPVDIICGGSPCQDLSVAGAMRGLSGQRSHLFFEMTRVIREMRDATNGKYPRYVIWENVPGAFSSNKGQDFRAVLQEFAQIADHSVYVPEPERSADRLVWRKSGEMAGFGWSIAWRTMDAQYWGVPQRRRRIYLVLDLGGERAGEILFERKSLSGDIEQGGAQGEEAAEDAHGCADGSNAVTKTFQNTGQGWWNESQIGQTLRTPCGGDSTLANVVVSTAKHCGAQAAGFIAKQGVKSGSVAYCEEQAPTLRAAMQADVVYDARGNGDGRTVPTLTGDHQRSISDYTAICVGNGQLRNISMAEQTNTLDCMHDQQAVLTSGKPPRKYIIRRLTPLECCRLQGFPDWWMDGVEGSNTEKYRMWGNGMALPVMKFVIGRIADREEQ